MVLVLVRNRFMHTTTNFLLANLAVAGLWIAIWSIPFVYFTASSSRKGSRLHVQVYLHEQPKRGIHSCFRVYNGNSMERYYALLKSMDTQVRLTKGDVKRVVAGLWLLSILLNAPTIIYAEYDGEQCVYVLDKKAYGLLIILFPTLASCIITFCYFRISKELYFSKTVCKEDVDPLNDLKSKLRISNFFLSKLLVSFCVTYHL